MTEIIRARGETGVITRCPKDGSPLKRHPRQFHWRGEDYDGARCMSCMGLWAIVGEEMPPLKPKTAVE